MNTTGGWTSIDEELDPDSTNPVQNKTLYNCLSFYLFEYDDTLKKYKLTNYSNNNNIEYRQLITVHILEDIKYKGDEEFEIADEDGLYSRKVISGYKVREKSTYLDNVLFGNSSDYEKMYLIPFNIRKSDGSYEATYFTKGTSIEMYKSLDWMIIGDPIVGRVEQQIKYSSHSDWDTFAEAVVYASGLKIQWGNFNPHSNKVQNYFPVMFYEKPSMSCSYFRTGDNNVWYKDFPRPNNEKTWELPNDAGNNTGTWMAIGY